MLDLVSVVIPVFNGERHVAEAVRSALLQSHPHKQILVINDGSNDGTLDVLSQFGDSIRVISVNNGGPARARNLGIKMAEGNFIAFLDADDVWATGKLAAQVRHLKSHPETGVCYTSWSVWPVAADGTWQRPSSWQDDLGQPQAVDDRSGWIYEELLNECKLLTTTVMLRTAVARAEGEFDVNLPVGEDYDYWLRLSQRTRIDRLDCVGALYRVVPGSASRKPYSENYELMVLRRALARFGYASPGGGAVKRGPVARRMNTLRFQHGWSHLHVGDPAIARQAFADCLKYQPWRPALWWHWMRAVVRASRAPSMGGAA